MLCKQFKDICGKYGWAVSDNGSDPVILCEQNEQGFAYVFPASHKTLLRTWPKQELSCPAI